ncbi:hypothetical protein Plano_2841 [Planococcus sp. PAMC 21323]|uniref:hypothetical protein n=1 Tax=Planococcus sp. PAMC 21323 TaxID=1526927 RepID=UPI0005703DC9|nr:hypothetical protein [Planococcus sp. PAMC 21323]AIY06806.1 hypothetical protein Plano_2841 [Planococcus sp. PAMC 21323]
MGRKKDCIVEEANQVMKFNLNLIDSEEFKEIFKDLNEYLIAKNLKRSYEEILQKISGFPQNAFFSYKKNSVVKINLNVLDSRHQNLVSQFIELDLFKRVSYVDLENEYLRSNNLEYWSLTRKENVQNNFIIILKLDEQVLNNLALKIKSVKNDCIMDEKLKEDIVEVNTIPVQNQLNNKEEFFELLTCLDDELKKMKELNKNNELDEVLNDTELIYTFSLLVSQCRLHKEIDLSINIGRPAFLWRFDQLKIKFKRMHPLKDEYFYIEKIDYLIKVGLIEKISFNQIDNKLLRFIEERELKRKPDLYVLPGVGSLSLISSKSDYEKIVDSTAQKNAEKEKVSTIYNDAENITEKENIEVQVEEKHERNNRVEEKKAKRNTKERVNYNLNRIKSEFFEEIYKPINEYLIDNKLKGYYEEILRYILEEKENFYLESKDKSVFYIDDVNLSSLCKIAFPYQMSSEEYQELFQELIEIGIIEKISLQNLAYELKLSMQELLEGIKNNFPENCIDGEDLYILLRLNESVLKKVYNNIKEKQRFNSHLTDSQKRNKEYEKNEEIDINETKSSPSVDYSITESALDILIESEIEGNKVTINKYYFDRLIKSILGEVPDM